MIDIRNKENCTGCSACVQICPNNSITLERDSEGFLYPKVDLVSCVNCGLCNKTCPVKHEENGSFNGVAYAAYHNDDKIRLESSSGGVFTALAETIINDGGIVCGATFNEEFKLNHVFVDKIEDLNKLRGSKYIQSEIGLAFTETKKYLEQGKKVLFTGTPCQIEGLLSYLKKPYQNLLTVDFICHGVPSQLVLEQYLSNLKTKQGSKVLGIDFRSKSSGWKGYSVNIDFEDGSKCSQQYYNDAMMKAFLKDLCLRPSCYQCAFKKVNRKSDITLADFWGVWDVCPEMYDNKGTSLIMVHSENGESAFNSIKKDVAYQVVEFNLAIKYNPSMIASVKKPKNRDKFLKDIKNKDFVRSVDKCVKPTLSQKIKHFLRKIKNNFPR